MKMVIVDNYNYLLNFFLVNKDDFNIEGNIIDFASYLWNNNNILIKEYGNNYMFFIFTDDNILQSIAGALYKCKNVIEIYSYTVKKTINKFTIIRAMYKFLKYVINSYDFARIQSTIEVDNITSRKVHYSVGFRNEGLLRKYDGIKDYYMFSYVRNYELNY